MIRYTIWDGSREVAYRASFDAAMETLSGRCGVSNDYAYDMLIDAELAVPGTLVDQTGITIHTTETP